MSSEASISIDPVFLQKFILSPVIGNIMEMRWRKTGWTESKLYGITINYAFYIEYLLYTVRRILAPHDSRTRTHCDADERSTGKTLITAVSNFKCCPRSTGDIYPPFCGLPWTCCLLRVFWGGTAVGLKRYNFRPPLGSNGRVTHTQNKMSIRPESVPYIRSHQFQEQLKLPRSLEGCGSRWKWEYRDVCRIQRCFVVLFGLDVYSSLYFSGMMVELNAYVVVQLFPSTSESCERCNRV